MEKPNVRLVSASVTDRGLSDKRPVNEDSYLEMPERGLFAVADGVGGAQAGDFASQTAMEVLQEAFMNPRAEVDTEELLEMAIQRANESIHQLSHELPQLEMMATTIVTLHIDGNIATIGHVGDSRLYRLDPRGNIFRETHDHSMVEEEVRAGRMTPSQAATHPSRNIISRALGAENTVDVEMRTIMFEPGTTFLLCSDGVTRHLEDHEIREILLRYNSLADVCREIKSICYSRGAEDNLTAVIVRVEDAAVPIDADDDETTVAGVRPVFAPNPLTALSNGAQRGASSTEARAEEFAAMNVVHPDAATAPLDSPPVEIEPETQGILQPASQTIGVTDTPVDEAAKQATLPQKLDNERIRSKIDSAEPWGSYHEEKSGGSRLFTSLLLLLIGVVIGAGGYFAWTMMNPPPTAAPTTQQPTQTTPPVSTSDLTSQEINEFRMFERVRRTVDSKPQEAQTRFQEPSTAADYYLRGRAFLLVGETANARKDLITAAEELQRGNTGGVNAETLKSEIAIAQAAVGALSLTREDRRMLEDLSKTKTGGLTTNETNTNAP